MKSETYVVQWWWHDCWADLEKHDNRAEAAKTMRLLSSNRGRYRMIFRSTTETVIHRMIFVSK